MSWREILRPSIVVLDGHLIHAYWTARPGEPDGSFAGHLEADEDFAELDRIRGSRDPVRISLWRDGSEPEREGMAFVLELTFDVSFLGGASIVGRFQWVRTMEDEIANNLLTNPAPWVG